jgi:hypothetical protein
MKRRLAAMAAALALMLTVFTVAAPNAFAIRDTGWQTATCETLGGNLTFYAQERVVWYASDNHRDISAQVWAAENSVYYTADRLGMWVRAVGGGWVQYGQKDYPDPYKYYTWTNYIPGLNPGQGHYFLARGTWTLYSNTYRCEIQILD